MAQEKEKNNIISGSMLNNILPSQLKKIYAQKKVMSDCECLISTKSTHSSLLSMCDNHPRQLKYPIKNAQNRSSFEMDSDIFEK